MYLGVAANKEIARKERFKRIYPFASTAFPGSDKRQIYMKTLALEVLLCDQFLIGLAKNEVPESCFRSAIINIFKRQMSWEAFEHIQRECALYEPFGLGLVREFLGLVQEFFKLYLRKDYHEFCIFGAINKSRFPGAFNGVRWCSVLFDGFVDSA